MGSWVTCVCGNRIHKNLFTSTGVCVVVCDEVLDGFEDDSVAGDCVSEIVRSGDILVRCSQCGRIAIEGKSGGITLYAKEESSS